MSDSQEVLLSKILLPPISGSRPSGGVTADIDGIPSIGGENIVVTGGMNYDELKRIPASFFELMPKGQLQCSDVLINKDGAQTGKVGLYDGIFIQAAINEHVFILRGRDPNELEQEYLYYSVLLPETRNKIERRITGSAQPGLNSQFVNAVDIPLRPIAKQRKIARILQTIDQTEALIEKYQQIKAGLMHDLFTRGIGADGKLRPPREQAPELYQQTPIGWIPKEWKFKPLDYGLSASPKNGFSPKEVDNWQDVYVLGLSCLTKNGFRPIQLKNAPKSALLSGAKLENGDFLISRSNTQELVGLCGIYRNVGHNAIYPDLMIKLKFNQNLVSEFLEKYLLSNEARQRISAIAVGTSGSMVKINSSTLKSLKVIYPEPTEQIVIVNKLRPVENQIDSLDIQLDKLKKQKSGLMHDLLTGKVQVKVDADSPMQPMSECTEIG